MNFEKFWSYLQENLKRGDLIENWSRDGRIRIKNFEIEEINPEYIKVTNTTMKIKKEHFKLVYNNWDLYIDCRLERNQITNKIRTSTYVIAIIHKFKK